MTRDRDCKGRQHGPTAMSGHTGSSFEAFLEEEGILEEAEAAAVNRVAAWDRGQSRRHSLLETCLSTAIGYVVAVSSQIVVFPLVGIHVNPETNLEIGALMTVVSVIRGFFVRRLFNHLHVKGIL